MPKALIFAPARGFRGASFRLRVEETVQALLGAGWGVDIVVPREDAVPQLGGPVGVFAPPRILRPSRVPDVPSLRGIYMARLMFLRALSLLSSSQYDVFHGYDDGACIARATDRATVRRYPFIAEFRNPVSTHDGPAGMFADIARRREKSAIRHAAAVIVPDKAMVARFEQPPSRSRISEIPEPQGDTNTEFFTIKEFESAILQTYEFAAMQGGGDQPGEGK